MITFVRHGETVMVTFPDERNINVELNIFGEVKNYVLNPCRNFVIPFNLYSGMTILDVPSGFPIAVPNPPDTVERDETSLWDPISIFSLKEGLLDNIPFSDKDSVNYTLTDPSHAKVSETETGMMFEVSELTNIGFSIDVWVKLLIGEITIEGNTYTPNPRQRDIKTDAIIVTKTPTTIQITTVFLDT